MKKSNSNSDKLTSSVDSSNFIPFAPSVYVRNELLCNISGIEFMNLKTVANKELKSNLMIDDRMIASILDRLSLLEKRVNNIDKIINNNDNN